MGENGKRRELKNVAGKGNDLKISKYRSYILLNNSSCDFVIGDFVRRRSLPKVPTFGVILVKVVIVVSF